MKKGRHRRFEEARSLKRSSTESTGRCAECGAEPDDVHASWCLAEEDKYDRILGSIPTSAAADDDPLERLGALLVAAAAPHGRMGECHALRAEAVTLVHQPDEALVRLRAHHLGQLRLHLLVDRLGPDERLG